MKANLVTGFWLLVTGHWLLVVKAASGRADTW
jgi:hypothetical protein